MGRDRGTGLPALGGRPGIVRQTVIVEVEMNLIFPNALSEPELQATAVSYVNVNAAIVGGGAVTAIRSKPQGMRIAVQPGTNPADT